MPNKAAQQLGRKGGFARAQAMTKAERSDAGKKAINARWAKVRAQKTK